MSSTTYIPHICDGLLSTQDKTSTLDRAVLLSGFDTTPVALGLHKNTAGFSILEINGNGKISKFTPTHVDSTRRHVLLGGNKVGFLARTSQSKRDLTSLTEDSHMILNVSTGTAVRVSGITGRLQDLVLLEAGLVIVGYASFFWLPRTEFDSEQPQARALASKVAPVVNIRVAMAGPQGTSIMLHNQNSIQVFVLSSKEDKLTLQFQAKVAADLGILFARHTHDIVVAVSDSGATLNKWTISPDIIHPIPETKTFGSNLVSAAHVDAQFIIVGHSQGGVEVIDTKTLETLSHYYCFPHPDELKSEPVSAVGDKSKVKNGNQNIQRLLEGLVVNIDRFGSYIIASTDSAVCVWNMEIKEISSPIKVRLTKGKIASKQLALPSSDEPDAVNIYCAVARSISGADTSEEKIAAKDLRVDCLLWRLDATSLTKATKRLQQTAAYQRALHTLLSRTVSNQLLDDVAFIHRLLRSTRDSRADSDLSAALVRVAARRDLLPQYLTAAVVENLQCLPAFAAEWLKLMNHMTGSTPPTAPHYGFLVRESNFISIFMIDFIRMEGTRYLEKIWEPLLRKLKRDSTEEWETDYRILYNSKRRSAADKAARNQLRLDCKAKAAENEQRVAAWSERFIDSMIGSVSRVPKAIAELLTVFFEATYRAYPEDNAADIIKNGPMELFISKFIIPALGSPSYYGIQETPSLPLRLNLGRIARSIDALAIGNTENHPLAHRSPDLFNFVCSVMKVDPNDVAPPPTPRSGRLIGAPNVTAKVKNIEKYLKNSSTIQVDRDYFLINQYIIKHAAFLYEFEGGSNYVLQAATSVMLRALAKQDLVDVPSAEEECKLFCVKNTADDEADLVTPSLALPDPAIPTQLEYSKKRLPPTDSDIPFVSLLSANPKNFSSLREWLNEEFKQHSFLLLVFFRGNWCPFCSRYMQSLNKYVAAILKRDGMAVGVSSMTQRSAQKTAANWKVGYPFIGDPFNELASMLNVEISMEDKRYQHGMAQPAIVALGRSGETLFFWKNNASLFQVFGAMYVLETPDCLLNLTNSRPPPCSDRPRCYNVLSSIVSALKSPTSAFNDDSGTSVSDFTERSFSFTDPFGEDSMS